jgi:hypothetical protein
MKGGKARSTCSREALRCSSTRSLLGRSREVRRGEEKRGEGIDDELR